MDMLFFVFVLLFMDSSCDTTEISVTTSCRYPDAPAPLLVTLSNNSTTEGTEAVFRCERGFELVGLPHSFCRLGKWVPDDMRYCKPRPTSTQVRDENAIETKSNETMTIPPQNILGTTVTPDYKNIFIYTGIGVLLAVVILAQIICFFTYIRTVRATRETLQTIIRSTSRNTNSTVRYSKTPVSRKRSHGRNTHVYESVIELDKLNRKPVPPPLETLPRNKIPPPPIEPVKPPIIEQMSSMSSFTDPQSSLRHEINSVKSIQTRELNPVMNRQKLPEPNVVYCTEPNVIPEKPATLPKKYNSTRINKIPLGSMSVPRSDVNKNELMEKLKKRQLLADNETSRSVSNVSLTNVPATPPRQPKRIAAAPMPPIPPPKPHVRNDSFDSDNEWTIEPLKPINLYNI